MSKVQKEVKEVKEVSLLDFAENHNTVLTRRGHKMTFSYLYRLIREHRKGILKRNLWFKYTISGERDNISIILDKVED